MADADVVLLTVADGVATLTLNRPESLNAWTPAIESRWNELLDLLATDHDVRALVVTGAGRGFCSGADRNALGRRSRGDEAPRVRERPLTSLLRYPKPVIAAVNGACVGLGLALALCCDVRFAAGDAKLSAPFARLGLAAEFRTPWLLPRLVGRGNALDLLLSGRVVLADEALQLGLVQRVLPRDELLPAAVEYAAEIADSCSPAALAAIKAQVAEPEIVGMVGSEGVASLADFAEGIAALNEHRRPNFPPLTLERPWWSE
ncbi:MAG: enoyl-CoA hydratase-related protein [Acidimicrobiia bacterium]